MIYAGSITSASTGLHRAPATCTTCAWSGMEILGPAISPPDTWSSASLCSGVAPRGDGGATRRRPTRDRPRWWRTATIRAHGHGDSAAAWAACSSRSASRFGLRYQSSDQIRCSRQPSRSSTSWRSRSRVIRARCRDLSGYSETAVAGFSDRASNLRWAFLLISDGTSIFPNALWALSG